MSTAEEVSRLLFTVFNDTEISKIRKIDLIRLWSLEMQWFNPKESSIILNRLVERDWLIEDGEFVELTPGLKLIPSDLGWRPITRRMLDPPKNVLRNSSDSDKLVDDQNILSKPIIKDFSEPRETYPSDVAEGIIPFLIKQIAENSGLPNNEVVRRAQRKRRALEPITLWMALALVAREQGIDMQREASVLQDFKE